MDSADRYRREQDIVFQELDAMERREKIDLRQMDTEERNRFFIRFWSQKEILEVLAAVSPEGRKEINDACFKAWKINQKK